MDCTFLDIATTGKKNTNWDTFGTATATTFNETVTDNGTVLDYESTGGTRNFRRYADQSIVGDFEILITVKNTSPDGGNVRLYISDSPTSPVKIRRYRITDNEFTEYKITRVGETITCYHKVDDEWVAISPETGANLSDEDCYFSFQFYTTTATIRQITYKDLEIYPI